VIIFFLKKFNKIENELIEKYKDIIGIADAKPYTSPDKTFQ
jgi:hypothetical protein